MVAQIRVLGGGDAAVLDRVAEGAFDGPINPAWSAEFLHDARHHIVVAIDDGVVVGMASGVHYLHPDKPPELWINEVAVAPAHQGRGIGRALLDALLAHARALGCRGAWVLTDRPNPPAERLYESAGGVIAAPDGRMYEFTLDAQPAPT